MNLDEAHDLIDMLLDKVDQPYFTDDEKNMFIDQAISAFINGHYQFYEQEQVSRDALQFFYHESYKSSSQVDNFPEGIFSFENWGGYKNLHENYMHLINLEVLYAPPYPFLIGYNTAGYTTCKILGSKDFLDLKRSSDPYNKPSREHPICYVGHGSININMPTLDAPNGDNQTPSRVHFLPGTTTGACKAVQLIFRNHTECFSNNGSNRVKELYQREIIDITVRKMIGNIEGAGIQFQQIETEQSKPI